MLVIPYLEHLIYVWNETDPYFHNSLIIQYKEMIVASNNTDSVSRKKLRRLLENDESFYNSDQVLDQFLDLDCLFEARTEKEGHNLTYLSLFCELFSNLLSCVFKIS